MESTIYVGEIGICNKASFEIVEPEKSFFFREMRVLQLIDTLRHGGAERMALNCANAFSVSSPGSSYLCCTRLEGELKNELRPEVRYLFLERKHRFDLIALLRLREFVKRESIEIVHAHGTSWFLAGLLKMSGASFKLLWHDHYGLHPSTRKAKPILALFSRSFDGIVAVNKELARWSLHNLHCPNILEIRNFISKRNFPKKNTSLLSDLSGGFSVICVANIRPQKDHLNLLRAFELLHDEGYPVSIHLIGRDPKTAYSALVLEKIKKINSSLEEEAVFYYGERKEIASFLEEADLGVLSSRSEALPLALLEYGMAGLPIVCTDVGKCSEVLATNGKVVPVERSDLLSIAIKEYFNNDEEREKDAKEFQRTITKNYSEEKVFTELLDFYNSLVN
ncbi:MAG: glycosyltransferase [Gillisia sp.]